VRNVRINTVLKMSSPQTVNSLCDPLTKKFGDLWSK